MASTMSADALPLFDDVPPASEVARPELIKRSSSGEIIVGDARKVLADFEDGHFRTIVTSPPYWGLRDYGIEGQIGAEMELDAYLRDLVALFRECRRVLANDGTFWLNIGDSFTSGGRTWRQTDSKNAARGMDYRAPTPPGLKPKDLIGVPWKLAFALQADGWWLRSDIVWAKPNPMPESVTDRPTRSHEYLFLLTKSERYFYDAEAIKEEGVTHLRDPRYGPDAPGRDRHAEPWNQAAPYKPHSGFKSLDTTRGRNKRDVWIIATEPFPGAHFAVMPTALVEPCVLAGTSPQACPTCGAPWDRVIERRSTDRDDAGRTHGLAGQRMGKSAPPERGWETETATVGFRPTCTCEGNDGAAQCVVLDPFGGSGTVASVAKRLGRSSVYIDANPKYADMARRRVAQTPSPPIPLFNEEAAE